MDAQRDRLFHAITRAVRTMDQRHVFEPAMRQLGREHRKHGVRSEHYPPFGRALIRAIATYSDEFWVPELQDAWVRAYTYLATTMMAGAAESVQTEPAAWNAEIVAHERRTADVAVLTLRPDYLYPFRAGQYASIETPYRPASWRTFSMARADRPDGLLEFHVRAVDAGFVSGPLVWRAAVGDVLKIGPPAGDMAIDKQSGRDVLLVAGGTGLAPLKAMVEEMLRWNTARQVTLFVGERQESGLYDLPALERLCELAPWLTVIPCLSEDLFTEGARGTLADVVGTYGTWTDHDVYVCGSPAMMRATLGRLRDLGIAESRISYDAPPYRPAPEPVGAARVIDLRPSLARRAARR